MDKWLTSQLSLPAYNVHGQAFHLNASDIPTDKSFICAKVNVGELGELNHLQSLGLRVITVNVQLRSEIRLLSARSNHGRVRLASPSDEVVVRKIARHSFTYDRFHADSKIRRPIADRIKEQWVANYFCGKRGDALFVVEEATQIAGFLLTTKNNSGRLIVDLIAVDEAYRGRRLGESLISSALEFYSRESHITELIAGTQISNISSLRLYQRLGLSISDAYYMLHYHSS